MTFNVPACLVLCGISVFASQPGWAQPSESDWSLARDKNDIQIYTAPIEGSKHKAVKTSMRLQGTSLHALTALIQDADACSEWADLCKDARVLEAQSNTDLYVYTLNDLPWPVSDRDAIAHVTWQQDPDTLEVSMHATLAPDKLPKTKGVIRLVEGSTSWKLIPEEDGIIRVESYAHVDPAGATPAWLTNRLLVDSPYTTNVALRELIATGRYDDAHFDFIKSKPTSKPTSP